MATKEEKRAAREAARLAAIITADIATLTATDLAALTTTQIAAFTTTQVDALTEDQLKAFTEGQFAALGKTETAENESDDDDDDGEDEGDPEPEPETQPATVGPADTDQAQSTRINDAKEIRARPDPYEGMTEAEQRAVYEREHPRTLTGRIAKALRTPGISHNDILHLNGLDQRFRELKHHINGLGLSDSHEIADEMKYLADAI